MTRICTVYPAVLSGRGAGLRARDNACARGGAVISQERLRGRAAAWGLREVAAVLPGGCGITWAVVRSTLR